MFDQLLLDHENKAVTLPALKTTDVLFGERKPAVSVPGNIHGAIGAYRKAARNIGAGLAEIRGKQQAGSATGSRPELRQEDVGAAPPCGLGRIASRGKVGR